jgi:hypothetical protein
MRAIAVAVAVAFVVLAPAVGAAATPQLVVDPGHPIVGKRALIEVRTHAAGPLALRLTSPSGVHLMRKLVRTRPGVWRAVVRFADDGQWRLQVPRLRTAATVLVLQPGGIVPPFKPNSNAAAGLATGGVILGR